MSKRRFNAPVEMSGTVGMNSTVTLASTLDVAGQLRPGAGGLMRTLPVVLADANTALTFAANGGRTNVIPDTGGNRTYTLPTPTTTGQYFHFVYGGAAADAHDNVIATVTTDDSVYFKGAISHLDTNADNVAAISDGNSNSKLTLNNTQTLDLHFLSFSTTVWYVWGHILSDTVPAFEDQAE